MTILEYNQCVDDYADSVFRFIRKSMGDEETAKDVVQDAFAKMWEKRNNIEGKKAKSYLFTAAYHTMIDNIRKNRKANIDDDFFNRTITHSNSYSDLKEILDEAIETLSDIQKAVILLRDYEGYSYLEIGKIVGLNDSQVKVYIYRARVALRKYIGSIEMVI